MNNTSLQSNGGFGFVHARDLLANPQPVPWLIEGVIECGALGQVFGPSGCGKTFLTLNWACSIATGTPWCGKAVLGGPVFYIAGEGHAGMGRRLNAWEVHNKISIQNAPLFISTCPASLMDANNAASVAEAVEALVAAHGEPALIVIDTLARNFGEGDENSNSNIGVFIYNIDTQLRARFGTAVLIVHHTGLTDESRARGASAIKAAMDSEYRFTEASKIHTLTCTKAKESEPPAPMYFTLNQVVLDGWYDANGELMTSAVLVPTGETLRSSNDDVPLKGANLISFNALAIAIETEGHVHPAELLKQMEPNSLTPPKMVREDVWRQRAYDKGISSGEQDAKQKAFNRARKFLLDKKKISTWGDWYWLGDLLPAGNQAEGMGCDPDTGHLPDKAGQLAGLQTLDRTDPDTLL